MKSKAVGYVRVSTSEQAKEGVSMENQEAKIRAYAALHEIELIEVITDKGVSAKDMNRPGVQSALGMLDVGVIDTLIIYKLDRLFRNVSDALAVSKQLEEKGRRLCCVTESIDTKSAMGKFFFTIAAAFAEMERNLISERTRDALQYKKKTGKVFNHAPYGFDVVDRELLENKKEQLVIEKIRNFRATGWRYQQIADNLNDTAVTAKRGGKWYPQTVKKVLEDNLE